MLKIFLKNQDKTKSIERYTLENEKLIVKFFNQETLYTYGKDNYAIIEVEELSKNELRIFEYFAKIADIAGIKGDDDKSLLANEYKKIAINDKPQSALFAYIKADSNIASYYNDKPLLFPFGSNLSQCEAVQNALTSQISIIEGPPGTGKTQTILNIIANLLYRDKSVAVVSNNNSAIQNVFEKLENANLDAICAVLGKRENKESFIQNQQAKLTKLNQILNANVINHKAIMERQITKCNKNLCEFFTLQNDIAKTKSLLEQTRLEFTHFKRESNAINLPKIRNLSALQPAQLLYFKAQIEESNKPKFWLKLKLIWLYGIGDFAFYKNPTMSILQAFEYLFYEITIDKLIKKIKQDSARFEILKQQDILNTLKTLSQQILQSHLAQKYAKIQCVAFDENDMSLKAESFIKQYPVIFSTTHSIVSSLNADFVFDYLICDESSQVDLATGALALSMAKNVVIVGDSKQLPNVITNVLIPQIESLNNQYKITPHYDYLAHSFLSSVCARFADVPKVLLKEHYRCHPKIIKFCNQKFYDNELIILSENDSKKDAISVRFTAQGNHARGRFNQREIDEIVNILPEFSGEISDSEIGIITPYNEQKQALQKSLEGSEIEIDTVHKFQGREKEAIVISVVNNEVSEFVDNPQILNVAITRAKRFLRIVVSPNFANQNSHIGDLIKYIQYNNFEAKQGNIKSIFDLLYRQNYKARQRYLKNKRKISVYDSENIAFHFINEILQKGGFSNLSVACHIPLLRVIGDTDKLNESEKKYALNPRTHIDFVIYHKMDKMPILAIEIDGYAFHRADSAQGLRDNLKNTILAKFNFPLLRLNTTGSNEKKRIVDMLMKILHR
ncbi:AAA domain-containing protein [Helicobacter sp. T3_23-1056]